MKEQKGNEMDDFCKKLGLGLRVIMNQQKSKKLIKEDSKDKKQKLKQKVIKKTINKNKTKEAKIKKIKKNSIINDTNDIIEPKLEKIEQNENKKDYKLAQKFDDFFNDLQVNIKLEDEIYDDYLKIYEDYGNVFSKNFDLAFDNSNNEQNLQVQQDNNMNTDLSFNSHHKNIQIYPEIKIEDLLEDKIITPNYLPNSFVRKVKIDEEERKKKIGKEYEKFKQENKIDLLTEFGNKNSKSVFDSEDFPISININKDEDILSHQKKWIEFREQEKEREERENRLKELELNVEKKLKKKLEKKNDQNNNNFPIIQQLKDLREKGEKLGIGKNLILKNNKKNESPDSIILFNKRKGIGYNNKRLSKNF